MTEVSSYDKVLLRKAKVIERCIGRARQEYAAAQGQFLLDYTRQDAVILNLRRACEAALDMAQRCDRKPRLGCCRNYQGIIRHIASPRRY